MSSYTSEGNSALTLPRVNGGRMKEIKDKIMEEKLIDILWLIKEGKLHPNRGYKQILSLINENTVDVSTTSISESDDLHDVSEWNAERSEPTEDSEGVVEGALAKRTDFGNKFYCADYSHLESKSCDNQCSECIMFLKFME